MKIDSHQHFWNYDEVGYPWIPRGSALARDWLPSDLETIQHLLGFDGSIAVQARQTVEETRWLLSLAEAHPRIRGVVGWADLRAPGVEDTLADLKSSPHLVGLRHVAQDEPDDGFLARPEFIKGVGRLNDFGLAYDILIYARQLPAALKLVESLPEQRFILDHIAKPRIKAGELSPWKELIHEMARHPRVFCKVSGMVTEAHHEDWRLDDLRPFLDVVFAAFGPDRLMFGSDWPVCLLAASYPKVYGVVRDYVAGLPASQQAGLFGANAVRAYKLKP